MLSAQEKKAAMENFFQMLGHDSTSSQPFDSPYDLFEKARVHKFKKCDKILAGALSNDVSDVSWGR